MAQPQVSQPPTQLPTREWLQPDAPKLQGDELKAAIAQQIVSYPQVVRSMVDEPLASQSHGNISYMLFDKPKVSKNGKPIYGFAKIRGNWNGESECKARQLTL